MDTQAHGRGGRGRGGGSTVRGAVGSATRSATRSAALALACLMAAGAVGAPSAGAQGVGDPAFYVDGVLYRTVGTPTDLSKTGAPAHSYDTIYQFFGLQPNVATAAPGHLGFNGGRWMVRGLSFSDYAGALTDPTVNLNGNTHLDSDEEVRAALAEGYATDQGVIKLFECPVIPVPRSGR